jgi:glycosyltransferase involved in cell wall biosynthesis
MGAVNFSLDLNLVKQLKKVIPLDIFVETGTFEGDTIEYVKDVFNEIHSVELSESYYNKVKDRFNSTLKVNLYLDSSENFLKKIRPTLKDKSVLYWLDAHWCVADKTAGEKSQCPLLDELKSIEKLNSTSIVIIDDARLFIAPPPYPHEITQWPDYNSIMELFAKLSHMHETMVLNDTIIYYPRTISSTIKEYAYENSINWLTVLDKSRDYDTLLTQQKDMLRQMEEKDEKIVLLNQDLVDKDEKIFSLSDDLVVKDKTIHDKEENITRLSKDLVGKEEEIDDLLNEIKDKDDKIVVLSDDLVGKQKENDSLLVELKDKDKKINDLSEDLVGKERENDSLLVELKDKDEKINDLSEDLVNKDKKIFALSDDLVEKNDKIVELSDDLVDKEGKIISLSNDLVDKEKEIVFLSESLAILKKRLSTPIWGLITLFQFHFPKAWDYIYKKTSRTKKAEEPIENMSELVDEIPAPVEVSTEIVKEQAELVNAELNEPVVEDVKIEAPIEPEEKPQKNKLGFFIPRLGRLNHYEPIDVVIPARYLNTKSKSDSLKVSVVTPSYNQAEFLERTIKSILDQNYSNFEYIIQDGASTDGSIEILEKYKSVLTQYDSKKDKGQADAINKGLKLTTGDILAWINSDDIYLPGTFNYIVSYFNLHPDVDVVYGHRVLIDNCDKEIGRWVLPPHDTSVLKWADFIPQETLFWRRSIWEKVGGCVNDEFDFAIDWDLLLRFQEAGAKIKRLPRFVAAFRIHPQQKTSAQIASLGEREMKKIRDKYIGPNVEHSEINKNIYNYLVKSEIYHKLYRANIFRY